MSSPIMAQGMPSPIYTPAVLQGEPPAWAHPTPSPSPLIRCPKEPPLEAGASAAQSVLMTQALLWEVIAPFIGQMLEALQGSIEQQAALRQQENLRQQSSGNVERAQALSPSLGLKNPDAFRSLFGPSPAVPARYEASLRRLEEDNEAEEREEKAFAAVSSSSAPSQKPHKVLQKKSKVGSPSLPGLEPSWEALLGAAGSSARAAVLGTGANGDTADKASLPQKVFSPSMPETSDEAYYGISDNLGGYNGVTAPVFLAYQQHNGGPGMAGAQRWADTRISPTVSPLVPMSAPPGEGVERSTAPQLVLATAVEHPEEGDSPDAAGAGNGEKSVMVCRHWKSKGWCRLEASCKFLHPDHKRGNVITPAPKATNGGNSGVPAVPLPEGSAGLAAKSSTRSRRAGRNRHGGAGTSSTPPTTFQGVATAIAAGPLTQTPPMTGSSLGSI